MAWVETVVGSDGRRMRVAFGLMGVFALGAVAASPALADCGVGSGTGSVAHATTQNTEVHTTAPSGAPKTGSCATGAHGPNNLVVNNQVVRQVYSHPNSKPTKTVNTHKVNQL